MSKTYFCVADVHGFYDEMMRALNEAGYDKNNESHIFVSCGDLLDRGRQPQECLDFVNSLPDDRKILIMGNHEILMRQMIYGGLYPRAIDYKNGTWQSAVDLTHADTVEVLERMRKNDDWHKYYNSCKYFAEIGDYVIVHGWVPCVYKPGGAVIVRPDWREVDDRDWEEATWLNGIAHWNYGGIIEGKTIICGHWNTSYGWNRLRRKCAREYDGDAIHDAFIDKGIVALDACTVVSKKVNCYRFIIEE